MRARLVLKLYATEAGPELLHQQESYMDNSASWAWQQLTVGKKADQDCWAEVYVENLSSQAVWFDDLEIATGALPTALVVQETHYDPWGLELAGIGYIADVTLEDKFTYNGKEKVDDLALNWLDYGARNYDARLGRWWSVDPLAHKFAPVSPYNYALNNPMRFRDPTGMAVEDIAGGVRYTGQDAQSLFGQLKDQQKRRDEEQKATYRQDTRMTYQLNFDGSHTLTKTTVYRKWYYEDVDGNKEHHYESWTHTETVTTRMQETGEPTEDISSRNEFYSKVDAYYGGRRVFSKVLSEKQIVNTTIPAFESLSADLQGYQRTIRNELSYDKTWNPYSAPINHPIKTAADVAGVGLTGYGVFGRINPWVQATANAYTLGSFFGGFYRTYGNHRGREMTIYSIKGKEF